MDSPGPPAHVSQTLLDRHAASGVIARCLLEQSAATPRTRLQRILGENPLHPEARSWYAGAIGELLVAQRLATLGPEFTVLHSVPVGKGESDIDHIVIGPSGVFTINTKHHRDARVWVGARKILVNGQPTDHLRNARHEAERAERMLRAALGREVPVQGALVIVGAKEIAIKQQPDITVLSDAQLVRWVKKRRPPVENSDLVAQLSARPQTWHVRGSAALGPDIDVDAFVELRDSVDAAATVHLMWVLGLGVAALGVTLAIVWPQLSSLF